MMFFTALAMPYLVGALALLSLLEQPFMGPVPSEGIVATHYADSVACDTAECWIGFYRGIADVAGVSAALADLKARTDDGTAAPYCHELLHEIGERAFMETGDLSLAYSLGDPFCRAGFYHGVLEGAFGVDGASLMSHLDELCARVPGKERYSYQYFSCVHGIGHGLMAYENHDLFVSLDGCAKLAGAWEQTSCAGGVFMENVMAHTDETPSRYFRDDDLLYPCTVVPGTFKEQCYLMQTSHMLRELDGDFAATFALCRDAAAPFRPTCFESLGRDASGYSGGDISLAHGFCLYGTGTYEQEHCVIGAAIDVIQTSGAPQAYALCEKAASEMCRRRVAEHVAMQ